jgi:hypothetical protein
MSREELPVNWRSFVQNLSPGCTLFPPAAPEQITHLETVLGTTLPGKLKELLLQTNGIWGETGEHLIWSVQEMEKNNLFFWNDSSFLKDHMPFNCLLFFGDDGGGDQYAYRILAGAIPDFDVFGWNHENDSRTWVVPSLENYLAGVIKRQLSW